jgi:hypothetical protein
MISDKFNNEEYEKILKIISLLFLLKQKAVQSITKKLEERYQLSWKFKKVI